MPKPRTKYLVSLFGILDQWKLSFFHPLIQGHSASDRHFLSNFGIMLLFPVFSHLYLTEYKESLSGKKEENQQRRNQYHLKNGEMEIEWQDKLSRTNLRFHLGFHVLDSGFQFLVHMTSSKLNFKTSISLSFYFHEVLEELKTYTSTNCHSERALRFVIGHAWISNLMSDAAFIWRTREISGVRLKSDLFWGFCSLNSFCSTLMFRVPLEMNSRSWEKTQWQIFGWFPTTMLVPGQMDTDIASHMQNSINFICSNMSHNNKKLQRPESSRRSLNIYLLPFPKFWTLYIGRFWFVFIIDWKWKSEIVSRIPDFLSCISDSKAQDFVFYYQKFPDSVFHRQKFPGCRYGGNDCNGKQKNRGQLMKYHNT